MVPKNSRMRMQPATLACFLYGVYIIPGSHRGVGLQTGMRTISQQEAQRRGLPSPHAQMSPWRVQLAV